MLIFFLILRVQICILRGFSDTSLVTQMCQYGMDNYNDQTTQYIHILGEMYRNTLNKCLRLYLVRS